MTAFDCSLCLIVATIDALVSVRAVASLLLELDCRFVVILLSANTNAVSSSSSIDTKQQPIWRTP